MNPRIEVLRGDITALAVDAIVNAANESLLGGGGVDGRIHAVAGPELKQECAKLGGCAIGHAKLTKAYKLPATYVIHTVGPRWKGGDKGEAGKLASCYRRCLEVARAHDVKTIAFPAISTGAFGYPGVEAAEVALATIGEELAGQALPERVILCAFDGETAHIYERIVNAR